MSSVFLLMFWCSPHCCLGLSLFPPRPRGGGVLLVAAARCGALFFVFDWMKGGMNQERRKKTTKGRVVGRNQELVVHPSGQEGSVVLHHSFSRPGSCFTGLWLRVQCPFPCRVAMVR